MQQLFRGLHYLHMNYIVHRDLKVKPSSKIIFL